MFELLSMTTMGFMAISVAVMANMLSVMKESSVKKKPHSTMALDDIQDFINAKAEVVYGGKTYAINSDCYKIGHDDSCNLKVSEKGVSGVQCEIRYKNNSFILSDIHSKNGTYVNGRRLAEDVELFNGDEISMGFAVMEFKCHNQRKADDGNAQKPSQQTE